MSLFSRIASILKTKPEPTLKSGLNVCLLQGKLERYTTDRLNTAMQAAWSRPHEPSTFFGMSLDDEHGLVKFNDFYIPVYFHDRRLDNGELRGLPLPSWASHNAFCKISFSPGDGLPTTEDRHQFTAFISLLCLELSNPDTTSFFYLEDEVFITKERLTKQAILTPDTFDPRTLAST